jgi:hypothetical protein
LQLAAGRVYSAVGTLLFELLLGQDTRNHEP